MTTRRLLSFANLSLQQWRLWRWAKNASATDQRRLHEAVALATLAHRGQWRDNGSPYILHPIRSALILAEELKVGDADLCIAAILHDVIEDSTVTTLAEIKKLFGSRVARLVKNNTRPRQENETEAHKRVAKPRKLRATMRADRETRLVKCADILDNMRDWQSIPVEHSSRKKFPRWFDEAKRFYLPLAQKTDPYIAAEMRKAYNKLKKVGRNQVTPPS